MLYFKMGGKIQCTGVRDDQESESSGKTAAASEDDVRLAKMLLIDTSTPLSCKNVRAFDFNVNFANAKTYEEENERSFKFTDDVVGDHSSQSSYDYSAGRPTQSFSMDTDLEM